MSDQLHQQTNTQFNRLDALLPTINQQCQSTGGKIQQKTLDNISSYVNMWISFHSHISQLLCLVYRITGLPGFGSIHWNPALLEHTRARSVTCRIWHRMSNKCAKRVEGLYSHALQHSIHVVTASTSHEYHLAATTYPILYSGKHACLDPKCGRLCHQKFVVFLNLSSKDFVQCFHYA